MAERVRTCRVCGCTDERACASGCWWLDERDDLCSSCAPAQQHVVQMTRGHRVTGYRSKRRTIVSIATCSCLKWSAALPVRHHRKMDALVRNHWREAVALAGGAHV